MGYADSPVMSGRYERKSTPELCRLKAEAEAAQTADPVPVQARSDYLTGFSTALTDEDRRYLDLCAELYARGEYDAAGRQPCTREQRDRAA